MKLNNRFIFGILSLVLAAVIAFVALPTIARQTNGKTEIVRITQPVLKGEQITGDNAEVVEVGGYNLPSNVAHSLDDVEGLYVTADLAAGDYILTSKVSTVPVSSDVALNDSMTSLIMRPIWRVSFSTATTPTPTGRRAASTMMTSRPCASPSMGRSATVSPAAPARTAFSTSSAAMETTRGRRART